MQHQEILSGEAGQRFVFDPPDGRPDRWPAPTVSVFYEDAPVDATVGACTIDPAETTLAVDATAGTTTIRVARTHGFEVGARYRMTAGNGEFEWLTIARIAGADAFVIKHPLVRAYAPGATIVGCRISIAVAAEWANARANLSDGTLLGMPVVEPAPVGAVASGPPIAAGPIGGAYSPRFVKRFRRGYNAPVLHHTPPAQPPAPQPGKRGLARYVLRWRYFCNGFEMSAVTYADLVSVRSEQIVTPADVDKRFPGGGDFVVDAIHAVRTEALGDTHAQRKLRDVAVLKELVPARANAIATEQAVMHGARKATDAARAEKTYATTYDRVIGRGGRTRDDGDDDDPPPDPEPAAKKPKRPLGKIPKLTKF